MIVHAINPSTHEGKRQVGLEASSEFQDCQGYVETPCDRGKKKKKSKHKTHKLFSINFGFLFNGNLWHNDLKDNSKSQSGHLATDLE